MLCLRTIADVRSTVHAWRGGGLTVGFVPTMGALHEGHVSLVQRSNVLCRRTIVSIVVNPIQFAQGEDFDNYPRQEARDLALLDQRGGCDVVFSPSVRELFPEGPCALAEFGTQVSVIGLGDRLCGVHRRGHFVGVATQVLKLLMITSPDVAIFGEKDYQQLQVIRRMVRDLNIPVSIEAGPTVRESDGLAMSSRNAYLSPALRVKAPLLFETLCAAARKLRQGAAVNDALEDAKATLLDGGFRSVDYFSLVDAESLEAVHNLDRPARLVAAAWLGAARLIDNIPADPAEAGA